MIPCLVLLSLAFLLSGSEVVAVPFQSLHKSGGAEHIVIVDKDHPASPEVEEVSQRLALHPNHPDVVHIYNNSAFRGFSALMQSHCLDLLANMTDIAIVEKASTVLRTDVTDDLTSLAPNIRANAPWGLQRISSSAPVGGNTAVTDYLYSYANTDLGKGADIYIIDTGIYTSNVEFDDRARMLWTFDESYNDDVGHGTHVSGIAAGNVFGVASNANIIGVKALGPDGGWSSNVVAAIDVVLLNHAQRQSQSDFLGSVMSISLNTGEGASVITAAVSAAVSAGIHACVAAGNSATDACTTIPASSGGTHGPAITVGSVDSDDSISIFSNYGDCVDVYAPGSGITSAWIGSPDANNTIAGTSMAAPHVTGIIAYAMSNRTLAESPSLMKQWIRMTASEMMNGTTSFLLANNGEPGLPSSGELVMRPRIGWTTPSPELRENAFDSALTSRRGVLSSVRSVVSDLFGLVETSAKFQSESWRKGRA
nr:subtilisin-like protease 2 [Quercus suber]